MRILLVSPLAEPVHTRKIPAALARRPGSEEASRAVQERRPFVPQLRDQGRQAAALQDGRTVELTVIAPEKSATETAYEASGWRTVTPGENTNGYRLVALPLRNPAYSAEGFEPDAIARVMQETQPEVIQVWGGAPDRHVSQVVWLKMRLCPRARVVYYGFNNLAIRWRLRTRWKWKLLWRQMAGGVEANSEGVKVMREAGFRRPLERIFWGISTDDFHPVDKAGLRERLGFGEEKIVGYVGRFVPEKGLSDLLAALRQMPASVHGVLIGAGPMQAELEREAAAGELARRVRFLGTMPPDKLVEYMNCFDALALASRTMPTWKEQYGRVIGEGMACGVPVVGSDSGAIPEVIGEAGLVAREGDAAALAETLSRAVFDARVREKLIAAGYRRVEDELSIQAMSGKLMEFYGRLINA
ncbi:MAG: glycosyltransferase [Acidobacteria bacterium]|nr:glycosyltransferase [Acidobacteriota bacterium]